MVLIIVLMIAILLGFLRTSYIRDLLNYIIAVLVSFKGIYIIYTGATTSFSSSEGIFNIISIAVALTLMVIGVDTMFSSKK